jgi:hypothetical protein
MMTPAHKAFEDEKRRRKSRQEVDRNVAISRRPR